MWKQFKGPLANGWEKQMHLHLIGYYAATKMDEVLIHAAVQANPERILISERNWSQKTQIYYFIYMRLQ